MHLLLYFLVVFFKLNYCANNKRLVKIAVYVCVGGKGDKILIAEMCFWLWMGILEEKKKRISWDFSTNFLNIKKKKLK